MNAVSRRAAMAMGLAAAAPAAFAAPSSRSLSFAVFRNGVRVGDHVMSFAGQPGALAVTTEVSMVVKLGPLPVYRYRHQAEERWSDGRFASLETTTNSAGKVQRVVARRTDGGVIIETGRARLAAPAAAAPLTHWNSAVLPGPLFNPQEGKMLSLSARRVGLESVAFANGRSAPATRWSLRGETQIDNWYDEAGTWAALRGKLPDGSTMEYRRL